MSGPATKPERLGDAPIEPEHHELMNVLGRVLDDTLNGKNGPRRVGFCLMVFPFDDGPGRCNYISNASRADVTVLLREQLARFEGMPESKGGHG